MDTENAELTKWKLSPSYIRSFRQLRALRKAVYALHFSQSTENPDTTNVEKINTSSNVPRLTLAQILIFVLTFLTFLAGGYALYFYAIQGKGAYTKTSTNDLRLPSFSAYSLALDSKEANRFHSARLLGKPTLVLFWDKTIKSQDWLSSLKTHLNKRTTLQVVSIFTGQESKDGFVFMRKYGHPHIISLYADDPRIDPTKSPHQHFNLKNTPSAHLYDPFGNRIKHDIKLKGLNKLLKKIKFYKD